MSSARARFPQIPGLEVVAKLGSGGMGDVLLARKRGTYGFEKLLAVKTVRTDRLQDPQGHAMFLDEARLLARIDHPSIAQVYDFGEADGLLYLTMEYISGPTIRDLVEDLSIPLEPSICARMIAEVCWALHAAHELTDLSGRPLGVVHRDVSPENLILTFNGRMKILDFGIALMRERTAPVTQVGFVRGKLNYMAPEQRTGDAIDRRADIYGLSLVFYELLTRRPLFDADSVFDSSVKAVSRNVPPPSIHVEGLPEELDQIVVRGLAEDPADRFPDAREMAIVLDRLLGRIGGPMLPMFVDQRLSSRRIEHDAFIKALLAGDEPPAPAPRRAATLPAAAESGGFETDVATVRVVETTSAPAKRRWVALVTASLIIGALLAITSVWRAPEAPAEPGRTATARPPAPVEEPVPPEPPAKAEPEVAIEPPAPVESPRPIAKRKAQPADPPRRSERRSVERKPKAKPRRRSIEEAPADRVENGIITTW